jgi:transposase
VSTSAFQRRSRQLLGITPILGVQPCPKGISERYLQNDALSGVEQMTTARKHYLSQQKASIVVRGLSCKGSIKEFCAANRVSEQSYYYWRATLIKAGIKSFSESSRKARRKPTISATAKRVKSNTSDEKIAIRRHIAHRIAKLIRPRWPDFVRLSADQKSEIITMVRSAPKPVSETLRIAGVSRGSYYHWAAKSKTIGPSADHQTNWNREKLTERADVRARLFAVFHSPPSQHGFNRTIWRVADLQAALQGAGAPLGRHAIHTIIHSAGYRWRKAKKVLTSRDPDYRAKLDNIQSILRSLDPNEGFFSVDEYGPFAVRCREGRKLVAPGENPTVPQWQKSKGVIILTVALELLTNQVTHFYSQRKNTDEMIKLLKVLLRDYKHLERLYLSWDAASWHISKKLFKEIESNNVMAYVTGSTRVEVVPLPSGAQFLNVIESIFSGMSRAVIQSSDYQSLDNAKAAIDRHFRDRNAYFRGNPKRAGKKIWGDERVPSHFSESHNCKSPR